MVLPWWRETSIRWKKKYVGDIATQKHSRDEYKNLRLKSKDKKPHDQQLPNDKYGARRCHWSYSIYLPMIIRNLKTRDPKMKNNTTFEKEGNNYITHFFLTSSIVWKNIYLPSEICKISTGVRDKDILKN
ncbi:unnamed protein product [Rhizophagus irregularis]|nr:unnamed protein product [Rhizophagus irregularis]